MNDYKYVSNPQLHLPFKTVRHYPLSHTYFCVPHYFIGLTSLDALLDLSALKYCTEGLIQLRFQTP